jgi:hypothetical protein
MNPEKQHIFDDPNNVRRVVRTLVVICIGLVISDFIYHRHVIHPWEGLPGFYALFGFVACVGLVMIARELRKLIMRDEDYYTSDEEGVGTDVDD